MKKTLLFFAGLSCLSLAFWLMVTGWTPELSSFAVGQGIFAANLVLWTVIVRELLESAAYSARAQREAEQDALLSEPTEAALDKSREDDPPEADTNGDDQPSKSRGQGLIVAGMAMKVALLGGGIYLCLAVFKLLPIYFVGGMAAGLAFFAVASYFSRK